MDYVVTMYESYKGGVNNLIVCFDKYGNRDQHKKRESGI